MRPRAGWLAVVLAALAGCAREAPPPAAPGAPAGHAWLPPVQVQNAGIDLAEVRERPVGTTLIVNGRVVFDDAQVGHVYSPVTGRVTGILAQLGDRVTAGAPLAVIASPDMAQAASDAVKARADVATARAEGQRQQELFDAHAGARRDLEAAQNALQHAEADLERAEEKARLLGAGPQSRVVQEYVLRAPIAGEVVARAANPGAEIQGQYGGGTATELFTIGNRSRVWVLGDVYEVDLPRVHAGAPAVVQSVAEPGRRLDGTVDWVSGTLDPASHTARVRVRIDNRTGDLRPEMYVTVSLAVDGRTALAIPRSALYRIGDEDVVFVQRGTTPAGLVDFERRRVEAEVESGGDYVAVTRGLAPGDKVVASGVTLLAGML